MRFEHPSNALEPILETGIPSIVSGIFNSVVSVPVYESIVTSSPSSEYI